MVVILVIFEGVRIDDIDFFLGSREEGRFGSLLSFLLFRGVSGSLSLDVLSFDPPDLG